MFLWEAWQDLTLIILMIAAVASLALGIKTEVRSSKHSYLHTPFHSNADAIGCNVVAY